MIATICEVLLWLQILSPFCASESLLSHWFNWWTWSARLFRILASDISTNIMVHHIRFNWIGTQKRVLIATPAKVDREKTDRNATENRVGRFSVSVNKFVPSCFLFGWFKAFFYFPLLQWCHPWHPTNWGCGCVMNHFVGNYILFQPFNHHVPDSIIAWWTKGITLFPSCLAAF